MASTKQIIANRDNSKLGGVKSAEGKSVSRYNARKHGILSQILTEYDLDEYSNFIDELVEKYGTDEGIIGRLIEQAATCYIQLQRANKAETEFMKSKLDRTITKTVGAFELEPLLGMGHTEVIHKGYRAKINDSDVEILMNTYCRYQTTLENRLLRLLNCIDSLSYRTKGDS